MVKLNNYLLDFSGEDPPKEFPICKTFYTVDQFKNFKMERKSCVENKETACCQADQCAADLFKEDKVRVTEWKPYTIYERGGVK